MRIPGVSMRLDYLRAITLTFILCVLCSAAAFGEPAAAGPNNPPKLAKIRQNQVLADFR
jgi:hypothetical protein